MTNAELMSRLATEALKAFDAQDQLPVKSADIKEWIRTHYPAEYKRLEPSWANNLLAAQGLGDTEIGREPGTYRYILRLAESQSESESESKPESEFELADREEFEDEPSTRERRKQREKRLYPALAAWVRAQGFGADDTSDSKSGGTWGNPDVTGIRVVEGVLGQNLVEIMTVEAKSSRANWKREFFEAVSHKRFANRVYFAFAVGSEMPSVEGLPPAERNEMRFYGEKFRVGILVIFLPDTIYKQLHAPSGDLPKINADEIRIEEIWPALHEQPDPQAVSRHLHDVLKLSSNSAIHTFAARLE